MTGLNELGDDVRPDEPGPPSDEDLHSSSVPLAQPLDAAPELFLPRLPQAIWQSGGHGQAGTADQGRDRGLARGSGRLASRADHDRAAPRDLRRLRSGGRPGPRPLGPRGVPALPDRWGGRIGPQPPRLEGQGRGQAQPGASSATGFGGRLGPRVHRRGLRRPCRGLRTGDAHRPPDRRLGHGSGPGRQHRSTVHRRRERSSCPSGPTSPACAASTMARSAAPPLPETCPHSSARSRAPTSNTHSSSSATRCCRLDARRAAPKGPRPASPTPRSPGSSQPSLVDSTSVAGAATSTWPRTSRPSSPVPTRAAPAGRRRLRTRPDHVLRRRLPLRGPAQPRHG